MTTMIAGSAYRSMVLGPTVTRTAALLPQTATAPIFNVLGGKILITSFVGACVVVSPATTNTLLITGTPTTGTAVAWCAATSVASKEVGTLVTLVSPVVPASALVVATAGTPSSIPDPFICNAGTITLTTSGSAATGTWQWILSYVPLDAGASVTAA